MIDAILERKTTNLQVQSKKLDRILLRVNTLIEEQYGDAALAPETIADYFGMSASYFKKQFKSATGRSLNDHITQYRLRKAEEYLSESSLPVAEIAQKCGFLNINYFYTLFKKNHGITASEYRELRQKRDNEKAAQTAAQPGRKDETF